MPVFDKWSKGEIKIAISGDHDFDKAQAIRAWNAEGGGKIPHGYTFHHDGHAVQTIQYRNKKVLIARMQLVPLKLNDKLIHIGSASMARRLAGQNLERAKILAEEINDLAINKKGPLSKVAKRFRSVVPKAAKRIGRLLPIVGGVVAILDFSENAEAHGVGGALLRSTPLLGDLVTVYDVGSDLAQHIKTEAAKSVEDHLKEANKSGREAHAAAAAMTAREFETLSKQIRISNPYFEVQSLKEPLENYYEAVRVLILLEAENKQIEYPADATPAEKAAASSYDLKLQQAKEQLERDIRQQTDKPAADAPRGPIG